MSLYSKFVDMSTNVIQWMNANSPELLSGIAVVGVIFTAVTAVEAYKQSEEAIEEANDELYDEYLERDDDEEEFTGLSTKEKFGMTWYYWIKVAVIGGATIFCICKSNNISNKRRLELIASYNLFKEGAEKFEKYAVEEIGKKKVDKIKNDIHEDELKEDLKKRGLSDDEISFCDAETGGALFKDTYTGQIFPSTYEKVYRAVDRVRDKLDATRTQDEYGNYNGGQRRVSVAEFIEDCGGEYSEAAVHYVFLPLSFDRPLPSKSDICEPHVLEYKNHMCTIVQLNYVAEDIRLFPTL